MCRCPCRRSRQQHKNGWPRSMLLKPQWQTSQKSSGNASMKRCNDAPGSGTEISIYEGLYPRYEHCDGAPQKKPVGEATFTPCRGSRSPGDAECGKLLRNETRTTLRRRTCAVGHL